MLHAYFSQYKNVTIFENLSDLIIQSITLHIKGT